MTLHKTGEDAIAPEVTHAWEGLLLEERRHPEMFPSGRLVYPHIFNDGWVFPLQRPRELGLMMAMAQMRQPQTVLEIGADKGGTFYHWVKCLPSLTLAMALEPRGTPYLHAFCRTFPVEMIGFARLSTEPAARLQAERALAGRPLDLLFIDGDKHSVQKDFDAWTPLMAPGGLVFIHDIVDDIAPRHVFLTLAQRYPSTTLIDGSEGLEAQAHLEEPIRSGHHQWLRIWGPTSCGIGVIHL